MRRLASAVLLLLMTFAPAWARDAEGRLALIQTPNNGMPAIVLPGATFDVMLTAKAELRLLSQASEATAVALNVDWLPPFEGKERGRCTVAADVPPGTYALAATANGQTDTNLRAVFVRQAYPESYVFVHLTDTHVGKAASDGQPASAVLRKALASDSPFFSRVANPQTETKPRESAENKDQAVGTPELAFVVITGDLTDDGYPDQFREFVEALNVCALPTFVCPGNHDRANGEYGRYFGPSVYSRRFGRDGYLFFDTKDFLVADDAAAESGDVMIARRALKDCRWTLAMTHRYDMEIGMRTQLALFVDDPVDLLVFGHWHSANTAEQRATPWGVRMVVTPALRDGWARPFWVRPQEIRADKPQLLPGMPFKE